MALTHKHQAFVNQYLSCFNSTEAYQRVYSPKNRAVSASAGQRLLRNVEIAKAISERLSAQAMGADEVLMRLAEHARGDMGAWLSNDGEIDISAMKEANTTRLLRKVKRTYRSGETEAGGTWEETRLEVELHDAQAALVQLGRHHKLFTDMSETKLGLTSDTDDRLLSRIARIAARIEADEAAGGTGPDPTGRGEA